ncbi:MAG: glycosyltransferase [Stygiobacter sp.]|nr:MAG: glycosyltransferase [Stygiobacter sp.]
MKEIKVGFSTRILPEYRVPVYLELSKRNGIKLIAYFGKGTKTGASKNANNYSGLRIRKLFTLQVPFVRNIYRVWHPTLLFYLIKNNNDVIIVEPTTNMFNNIFTFLYCKMFRKKFIWYEAGGAQDYSKLRRILRPLEKIMIYNSDAFITYNSSGDEYLVSLGQERRKIFRAQNTVDTTHAEEQLQKYCELAFKEKETLRLNNYFILNYTGGVEKRKKLELLFDAVKYVELENLNIACFIVGDGPALEFYKQYVKEKNISNVYFWGRKIEDVHKYFAMSDLCILPSEGGLLINDAFSVGKPIIVTEEAVSGGKSVQDYITNGNNGFLIEKNNSLELSRIIKQIMLDKELYNKLCGGSSRSNNIFSIKNMVDGIEKAINFAIDSKKIPL